MAKRRRRYSRRGRKSKGRRGSKAIPLVQAAIIGYPVLQSYQQVGLTSILPAQICYNLTGYNPTGNTFDSKRAIAVGGALIVAQLVGSKIANRTGANRMMKKLTGGMVKVA